MTNLDFENWENYRWKERILNWSKKAFSQKFLNNYVHHELCLSIVGDQWYTVIPLVQKITPNSAGEWQKMASPSIFKHPVCKLRKSCGELEPKLSKIDQF